MNNFVFWFEKPELLASDLYQAGLPTCRSLLDLCPHFPLPALLLFAASALINAHAATRMTCTW